MCCAIQFDGASQKPLCWSGEAFPERTKSFGSRFLTQQLPPLSIHLRGQSSKTVSPRRLLEWPNFRLIIAPFLLRSFARLSPIFLLVSRFLSFPRENLVWKSPSGLKCSSRVLFYPSTVVFSHKNESTLSGVAHLKRFKLGVTAACSFPNQILQRIRE